MPDHAASDDQPPAPCGPPCRLWRAFADARIAPLILLLLVLGLLVPMAATGYYIFRSESRDLIAGFHAQRQRSAEFIAQATSSLLWNLQRDIADASLRPYLSDPRFCEIRVDDLLGGKVFVELKNPERCVGNLYSSTTPIRNADKEIGSVYLVMSDQPLQRRIHQRVHEVMLIFGLQVLAVALVLVPALVFKVIRPLRRLREQTHKLSHGDLDTVFEWQQKDEVGQVGTTMEHARAQLKHFFEQQARDNRALARQAITDPLTGLFNRALLDEKLHEELQHHHRYGDDFGVILIDIDHFKAVNDGYGHLVGDLVLIEFARRLEASIRERDIVGRWGGEEFLILCPATPVDGLVALAGQLREIVVAENFPRVGRCTASFGVAASLRGEEVKALLQRADEALYRAKVEGRDRVRAA